MGKPNHKSTIVLISMKSSLDKELDEKIFMEDKPDNMKALNVTLCLLIY